MTAVYYKSSRTFEAGPARPEVGEDYYIEIPLEQTTNENEEIIPKLNIVDLLNKVGYNVSDSGIPAFSGYKNTPEENIISVSILDKSGNHIEASGENTYDILNELAKQLPKPE